MDGQGTYCRRNIAKNLNRLSRAHERYRRQTDGRATAYSEREREFIKNGVFARQAKQLLTGIRRPFVTQVPLVHKASITKRTIFSLHKGHALHGAQVGYTGCILHQAPANLPHSCNHATTSVLSLSGCPAQPFNHSFWRPFTSRIWVRRSYARAFLPSLFGRDAWRINGAGFYRPDALPITPYFHPQFSISISMENQSTQGHHPLVNKAYGIWGIIKRNFIHLDINFCFAV